MLLLPLAQNIRKSLGIHTQNLCQISAPLVGTQIAYTFAALQAQVWLVLPRSHREIGIVFLPGHGDLTLIIKVAAEFQGCNVLPCNLHKGNFPGGRKTSRKRVFIEGEG